MVLQGIGLTNQLSKDHVKLGLRKPAENLIIDVYLVLFTSYSESSPTHGFFGRTILKTDKINAANNASESKHTFFMRSTVCFRLDVTHLVDKSLDSDLGLRRI